MFFSCLIFLQKLACDVSNNTTQRGEIRSLSLHLNNEHVLNFNTSSAIDPTLNTLRILHISKHLPDVIF